jgi:hypothetical protein
VIGGGALLEYLVAEPQYCWLAFGSEAKTRVLLTFKGDALFIDREAEGNLKGAHKRVTSWWDYKDVKEVTITDPDGATTYVISRISPARDRRMVWVDIRGPLKYQQYCDIGLSDDPEKAPVAHFHGPLTVQAVQIKWQLPPGLALRRGEKPTQLSANVGTLDAAKGCWVVVQSEAQVRPGTPFFPKGVHPIAEVEFPSQSPSSPPIKRRYPLDKFC